MPQRIRVVWKPCELQIILNFKIYLVKCSSRSFHLLRVACNKSDVVEKPGREVQYSCPTNTLIIKVEESLSIPLSKGWNTVAVTYNHLNGCKCHNGACSWEGNGLVCLNLSQSSWGNVLDTGSYLRCPLFQNYFYLLSMSGCSLSPIRAAVSGLFVCEG